MYYRHAFTSCDFPYVNIDNISLVAKMWAEDYVRICRDRHISSSICDYFINRTKIAVKAAHFDKIIEDDPVQQEGLEETYYEKLYAPLLSSLAQLDGDFPLSNYNLVKLGMTLFTREEIILIQLGFSEEILLRYLKKEDNDSLLKTALLKEINGDYQGALSRYQKAKHWLVSDRIRCCHAHLDPDQYPSAYRLL